MNKDYLRGYIIEQWKLAKSDMELATSEAERVASLRECCRLKCLAAECIGFDFADSLM